MDAQIYEMEYKEMKCNKKTFILKIVAIYFIQNVYFYLIATCHFQREKTTFLLVLLMMMMMIIRYFIFMSAT